jgi:hypothetical protein
LNPWILENKDIPGLKAGASALWEPWRSPGNFSENRMCGELGTVPESSADAGHPPVGAAFNAARGPI